MPKAISQETMYRLLIEAVRDYAIYMLDPDGIVLNWNIGAERAKGYSAREIVGRNYECFFSHDDRKAALPSRNLATALREGHYLQEGWRYRKDGSAFWASVTLTPVFDEGEHVGFAKITRDLTQQRTNAQELEHQASHDGLTGINNRVGFLDHLQNELPQVMFGAALAVHYVDLDRFKPVNDSFGHDVGDEVLRTVAKRLSLVAGNDGVIGRLGGDEFAILQLGSPDDEAIAWMAARIVTALNEPIKIEGKTAVIGASVGVAQAPKHGADEATILRNADLALYKAKEDGRNCVRFFDPSMNERALQRSVLETKLRIAVASNDFELHYQPVVDAQTNRIIGFEALLRWQDQTGKNVSPAVFIPLAEELNLMGQLGEWVLRTACRAAAAWQDDLVVSVNLSATQLCDEKLVNTVRLVLAETGLRPDRLELEITETAILGDLELASYTIGCLRDLGVGIALDDFGTGFSSLSLVKHLPLTRIKIDRSFVSGIDDTRESTAVIRSVVSLCEGYGLSTTAEGVETDEQRIALVLNGCSHLQGYLLGRPQPSSYWPSLTISASHRATSLKAVWELT